MTYDMTHTTKRHIKTSVTARALLMTLVMLLGATGVWAQTDYSGTYFIANGNGYSSSNVANNFYLVPATNSNYDTGQPHLTTSKTGQVLNCCWRIEKSGNYYHIIHVADGKYLTANPAMDGTKGNDVGRLRVHLQEFADIADDTDGNTLFNIVLNSKGGYNIRHKDMSDKINNSTTTYLDPAGGNVDGTNLTNTRTAKTSTGTINVGGGIGYWTDEPAARWHFEEVPQNNTYTYNIVDRQGRIAIKYTTDADQPAAKALSDYTDIPEAIRSPYLDGETVQFYTFSDSYSTPEELLNLLTDENKIAATPVANNANIYVTYTTDHLTEKFLHLRGARAFNIKDGNNCLYDNSGTLDRDPATPPIATTKHLWNIKGGDPYAVEIQNLGTSKYLVFSTPPTLGLEATATTRFILMEESASVNAEYETVRLMAATGTKDTDYTKKEVTAYPVSISTTYHLIDKAGRLIADIPSAASELALPTDWVSPLVSAYHYYKTASIDGSGVYTLSYPITTPFDVGDGGDIYVNYDVSDVIDLEGTKTYMMRFSDGEYFNQEDGHDGINEEGHTTYGVTSPTKAVYPYNNGDFNLYVYGQEQWEAQLSSGASTRSRWLWYIKSRHDGVDLTGEDVDPYHVVIKSYQNHTVKDKSKEEGKENDDVNYGDRGSSYLQTYKPSDYASVITNIAYENVAYNAAYPEKMRESMVNGTPTEYMILGTSLLNMTLKTFNKVEGERRVVNSFEQYWKNNPTVENLVGADPAADNATLAAKGWHRFTSWAYSAPWGGGSKTLHEDNHWYQTISMGSGQFTFEEVSLTPQVILLDQHGWEIMRVPLTDTETLRKFDSPMVEEYHWYPKADKTTGYHKYRVSNQEIPVYDADRKVIEGATFTHNSTTLTYTPYDYFETIKDANRWVAQDDRVKSDFYVTYTVKPRYTSTYTGAATADATKASSFLLKQGGSYAATNGSVVETAKAPADINEVSDFLEWYLKPNFDIDREMGYRYEGETGAQSGAKSKNETEQDYYDAGKNGFDPYNVQIQSKAYPLRYFTANTSSPALSGGTWAGTSSAVTLQNLNTKQTATGYDQTTLNITNATFMVVADANDNMRLMPRFDHTKVVTFSGSTPFTSLATQAAAATAGDQGKNDQTLWLEIVPQAIEVHSSSEMTEMNGHYFLAEDFTFESGFTSLGTSSAPFTGVIDGQYHTYSRLNTPLVAYANGAKIRNLLLDDVSISGDGNVGTICNEARGDTRIYNCGINGGSVSGGSTYAAGGIVGLLDGTSRVINCYSYADITGGNDKGGIVGKNNVASTQASLTTMVMNCMFYGDIVEGNNVSPIYGGTEINNVAGGLNTYNYYRYNSPYSKNGKITSGKYNRALAMEEMYITRFERYRLLLNSNKKLAAKYASTTSATVYPEDMAKWVLETADRSISNPKRYPVLKAQGKYPSIINYDIDNAPDSASVGRNHGGKLGKTLIVHISGVGSNAPAGAEIVTSELTLQRTDKDFDHFNYNYDKVQLPYYNDVGTKNYTGNRAVTGWKITSFVGGTPGTYTANDSWGGYNFADRNCTNKDLYGTGGSNRVFSQGAYYDVPNGVTEITIEPYWATAAYVSDNKYDAVYNSSYAAQDFSPFGVQYGNDTDIDLYGDGNTQKVYTSIGNALAKCKTLTSPTSSSTVYDYAVVLVGNVHQTDNPTTDATPYTLMSIDMNFDNEPDYSYIFGHNDRQAISPIRYDFLNIVGIAEAQIPKGASNFRNVSIFKPKGWFEITNTCVVRFSQFEYDNGGKSAAPLILLGGAYEQFVSTKVSTVNVTQYIHVGGSAWFAKFGNGTHSDGTGKTKHIPISVTGGDYDEFYLSGTYQPNAGTNADDHAECYVSGGSFGEMAGASLEQIDGNVQWQINWADITSFYGGGVNGNKPITGYIQTDIMNSHVGMFCGGPKFGNMSPTKTVVTNATACTFDTYCGAGYGGTSLNRVKYKDEQGKNPYDNQGYYADDRGKYFDGETTGASQTSGTNYGKKGKGVATDFDYEFFVWSTGVTGSRFYVKFASFSLAQTNNVTSTLTGCRITGNFFGGGYLGKVSGDATSTLNNCTVDGSVYGGGYSASLPPVYVRKTPAFTVKPAINKNVGMFEMGEINETETYQWKHVDTMPANNTTGMKDGYVYTDVDLTHLGVVTSDAKLTLDGTTSVTGSVFGGGDESAVNGNTTVNIQGNTEVNGDVFGGGNRGMVSGNTTVNIRAAEPEP